MESLQNWGLMGEIYIGCGFIRGKLAGIYYDILERGGVAARGCGTTICRGMGSRRNSRPSWWSPGGGCGLVQGFGSTPTRRGRSFSV